MTITEASLAEAVGILIANPSFREKLANPAEREFIDQIEKEVRASEKPSALIGNSSQSLSASIRQRVVAGRLAVASLHAADVGAKEDEKRASGSRNRRPSPRKDQ